MTALNNTDSPCVDVCELDPATRMCVGCFRTIEEIAGWTSYTDEQKAAIRGKLAARRVMCGADEVAKRDRLVPGGPGTIRRCGRCNAEISCGASNPDEPCWCTKLPRITPPIGTCEGCLCPGCLAAVIEESGSRENS